MTTTHIPAETVLLLRTALLSELGSPASQLAQVSVTHDKEKHPDWFQQPLAELEEYRAILHLLGWEQPAQQQALSLDLDPHRHVIVEAMSAQLRVEHDYMAELADVEGAKQQRETATRNARIIEEFMSTNRLAGGE